LSPHLSEVWSMPPHIALIIVLGLLIAGNTLMMLGPWL
jgi:hypothetical protein